MSTNKRNYITTACQHCRRRKAKCTGKPECQRCVRLGIKCQFTIPVKKRGPPKRNREIIESTLTRVQKSSNFACRNDVIDVSTVNFPSKNMDLLSSYHTSARNSAFYPNGYKNPEQSQALLMTNYTPCPNGIHLKETETQSLNTTFSPQQKSSSFPYSHGDIADNWSRHDRGELFEPNYELLPMPSSHPHSRTTTTNGHQIHVPQLPSPAKNLWPFRNDNAFNMDIKRTTNGRCFDMSHIQYSKDHEYTPPSPKSRSPSLSQNKFFENSGAPTQQSFSINQLVPRSLFGDFHEFSRFSD